MIYTHLDLLIDVNFLLLHHQWFLNILITLIVAVVMMIDMEKICSNDDEFKLLPILFHENWLLSQSVHLLIYGMKITVKKYQLDGLCQVCVHKSFPPWMCQTCQPVYSHTYACSGENIREMWGGYHQSPSNDEKKPLIQSLYQFLNSKIDLFIQCYFQLIHKWTFNKHH